MFRPKSSRLFPSSPAHNLPAQILQRVIHNFHKVFHTLYPLVCKGFQLFSNITQFYKW